MTTTDTDALTERIADALTEHWKRNHSTLLTSGPCSGCSRAAADAVAEEVRAAKAEAWERGGSDHDQYNRDSAQWEQMFLDVEPTPPVNPYRDQEDTP